jgi:hypothetical protein
MHNWLQRLTCFEDAEDTMMVDTERGSDDRPVEQANTEATDVSRRKALGRLGLYTAPALLAMLISEKAVAATDE